MTSLFTSLSSLGEGFAQPQLLINTLLKVSIVLAAAGLVNALLQRSSAAIRHWVWSLAFYSLFLLPFLSQVVPGWSLQWLPGMSDSAAPVEKHVLPVETTPTTPEVLAALEPIHPTPEVAEAGGELPKLVPASDNIFLDHEAARSASIRAIPLSFWIFAIWAAGSILLVGRMTFEQYSLWWLVRMGRRINESSWTKVLQSCKSRLNLQRQVHLIFSNNIAIPITFGLFRSVILLPIAARHWSGQELEIVLIHELEHVRRWDYVCNLSTQLVCAFYWPNPLVWIAEKWQRIERERACDDTVIGQGAESGKYASYLLDLAKSLPAKQRIHAKAIGIAHNSELKNRLGHILSQSITRTRLPRTLGLISAALVVSVLVPLAAVHLEPRATSLSRELDPNSVEALIRLLQSDQTERQKRAAWALGEREDRKAVTALISALGDNHAGVRGMVAWALGEIKDRRALRPLIAALNDADAYPREMVVRAMGELEDRGAVRPLIDMLTDWEPNVRVAALWALEQIGDKDAFYAVVDMLNDSNTEVRKATLRSLRGIGCDPAFVAITASLKDRDPNIREAAAKVLGDLTNKPTDKALPDVLFEYSRGGYRSFLHLLPKIERKSAIEYLIEALQDPVTSVRVSATETLGKIGAEPAIEALIAATQDPDSQVRSMAVWALDEINLP